MGVVYHANYLIWFDRARTELMRETGLTYNELEQQAGCPRPPAPLVPQPLAPADRDSAVAWSRATLPLRYTAIRFRWKYQDDQKRWGGRGQARIAPPDSLRFDYVGPLGLGAGAAAIV